MDALALTVIQQAWFENFKTLYFGYFSTLWTQIFFWASNSVRNHTSLINFVLWNFIEISLFMTVTTPYINQSSTYPAYKIAKNISFESLFWSERVGEIFLSIMFFENFVGMPLTCTPMNFSGAFFSNVKWCALSDYERKKCPTEPFSRTGTPPKTAKILQKVRGMNPQPSE